MNKLNGKNILVVDDEPGITISLSIWLKNLGATTMMANSGKEAFQIISNMPCDLVISDVRMPNGGGVELLEKIKEHNPNLPSVLLATGFAELTQEEAIKKGAEALLIKPLDFDLLLEKIITVLDKNRTRREGHES